MKKSRYSKYTTDVEQKELRAKYCGIKIPDAAPRSDWMTVDECFDDVIEFVSFLSNRQSGAVGLPNIIIWSYYFWKKDVENEGTSAVKSSNSLWS